MNGLDGWMFYLYVFFLRFSFFSLLVHIYPLRYTSLFFCVGWAWVGYFFLFFQILLLDRCSGWGWVDSPFFFFFVVHGEARGVGCCLHIISFWSSGVLSVHVSQYIYHAIVFVITTIILCFVLRVCECECVCRFFR